MSFTSLAVSRGRGNRRCNRRCEDNWRVYDMAQAATAAAGALGLCGSLLPAPGSRATGPRRRRSAEATTPQPRGSQVPQGPRAPQPRHLAAAAQPSCAASSRVRRVVIFAAAPPSRTYRSSVGTCHPPGFLRAVGAFSFHCGCGAGFSQRRVTACSCCFFAKGHEFWGRYDETPAHLSRCWFWAQD